MDGPDSYRMAAAILEDGSCDYGCPYAGCAHEMAYLARAQVYATLALTASVIAGSASVIRPSDRDEWQQAIDPEDAAEVARDA